MNIVTLQIFDKPCTIADVSCSDVVEFNCLRENPDKEGEYIYFGTDIKPTDNLPKAIERVKEQVRFNNWEMPIWICGYWKGGKCYEGGEYETLGEWIRCN